MIAVDTSVVVAGFASWHEGHGPSAAILAKGPRVPAHVLVETYSVLTRLPPPHRAPPDIVRAFLTQRFRRTPLTLKPGGWLRLLDEAVELGVTGGAVYDALIAASVRQARATLFTRDRRATVVYEKMRVAYELFL